MYIMLQDRIQTHNSAICGCGEAMIAELSRNGNEVTTGGNTNEITTGFRVNEITTRFSANEITTGFCADESTPFPAAEVSTPGGEIVSTIDVSLTALSIPLRSDCADLVGAGSGDQLRGLIGHYSRDEIPNLFIGIAKEHSCSIDHSGRISRSIELLGPSFAPAKADTHVDLLHELKEGFYAIIVTRTPGITLSAAAQAEYVQASAEISERYPVTQQPNTIDGSGFYHYKVGGAHVATERECKVYVELPATSLQTPREGILRLAEVISSRADLCHGFKIPDEEEAGKRRESVVVYVRGESQQSELAELLRAPAPEGSIVTVGEDIRYKLKFEGRSGINHFERGFSGNERRAVELALTAYERITGRAFDPSMLIPPTGHLVGSYMDLRSCIALAHLLETGGCG